MCTRGSPFRVLVEIAMHMKGARTVKCEPLLRGLVWLDGLCAKDVAREGNQVVVGLIGVRGVRVNLNERCDDAG